MQRNPTFSDPYVSQPSNAFTQPPVPTPHAYDYDYGAYSNAQPYNAQGYGDPYYGGGNVAAPGRAQAHPGMS